jgi:hypothetical protein
MIITQPTIKTGVKRGAALRGMGYSPDQTGESMGNRRPVKSKILLAQLSKFDVRSS